MKIIRICIAFFLVFTCVFTIFYGAGKITEAKPYDLPVEYKGVIKMWQIDCFEGGIGSRKQFLLKSARSFEKQNEGVLVMVIDHTIDGAKENFKNGIYPDLISFGNGVDVVNLSQINCNKNIKGGMVGENEYATAWCRGGYVLISKAQADLSTVNEISSVIVSQAEYTQPLAALSLEGIIAKDVKIKPPYDAYVDFVSGKTDYLLGTQRDVIRLERRGMEVNTRALKKYNDLYQYVAIVGTDKKKNVYAERFIEWLVSEPVQKDLCSIGMFSCFYENDYENLHMQEMGKITFEHTVSAFASVETLKEMQRLSILGIGGDEGSIRKIKNMLI